MGEWKQGDLVQFSYNHDFKTLSDITLMISFLGKCHLLMASSQGRILLQGAQLHTLGKAGAAGYWRELRQAGFSLFNTSSHQPQTPKSSCLALLRVGTTGMSDQLDFG